jgi:hypothetical protein
MDTGPVVRQVAQRSRFSAIAVSSSGDNTVVAAVPNRRIRVIRWGVVCAAAVAITWKSSTAGAISGARSFAANGGLESTYCPEGLFQTAIGEALVLNLSSAVAVGGDLTYIVVDF